MSIDHLLSLPRWLVVAIIVVVALLGLQEHTGDGPAARAQSGPCTFRTVDYTYGTASAAGARRVTGAEITGIAPACEGRTMRLTFTAADGSPIAAATGRVQAPSTVLALRPADAIAADRVDGFDVVLHG